MEDSGQGNPWGLADLEEFLFYCCPECDEKFKDSHIFVNHATNSHESAKVSKCETVKTEEHDIDDIPDELDHQDDIEVDLKEELELEPKIEVKTDEVQKEASMKKWKCDQCDKSFKNKVNMVKHFLNVHNELKQKSLSCEYCEAKFTYQHKLVAHIRNNHNNGRSLKCDKCDYDCKSDKDFKLHYSTHAVPNEDGKLPCEHCDWIGDSKSRYVLHIIDHMKEVKCDKCDHISKNINEHKSHYLTHDFTKQEDGRFKCNECNFVLQAGKALSSHKHWKCDICEFSGMNKEVLQRHQVEKHSMDISYTYICDKCDYKTFSLKNLEQHRQTVHESKTEMCTICGKDFKYLKQHMKRDHTELANKVVCDLCGKEVKDLYRHLQYVHEINLCTICNKFLPNKNKLLSHYSTEHQVFCLNKEKFVCHLCKDKYQTSQDLHEHLIKEHKLVDEHHCSKCEYSFPTKTLLAMHLMNLHEYKQNDAAEIFGTLTVMEDDDKRKFSCDICNRRFSSKRTLNGHHKQFHDKSKHYNCDQCDYSSFEKHKLNRHMLLQHSKATKFPCELCSYVTNIKAVLNGHMKVKHEGLKQYSCKECGKEFRAKVQMANHLLQEHNIVYKYS